MKTICLSPPNTRPPQRHEQLPPKVFPSNLHRINAEQITKISDIIIQHNKKMRQSSNIFYVKLQETQAIGNVVKGLCSDRVEGEARYLRHEPEGESAGPRAGRLNRLNLEEKEMQRQIQSTIRFFSQTRPKFLPDLKCQQSADRTPQLVRKQARSLTKGNVLKPFDRYQKSKVFTRPSRFQTELLGIQKKTFYKKIKPINLSARSYSDSTQVVHMRRQNQHPGSQKNGRTLNAKPRIHPDILTGLQERPGRPAEFTPWGTYQKEYYLS